MSERGSDGGSGNHGPSGGSRSGPRRGPPAGKAPGKPAGRPPRDPAKEEADRKARELSTRAGIPLDRARRVVAGQEKLAEVVEEMARRDRVEALMARHGLNRALATQVELGQASLEGIMARRHIEEEFTRTRDKSVYDEAVANKREYTFGLHDHRTLRAIVTANEQYEFVYVNAETKEPGREHKLQVKYAFPAEDYKKIRKGMDFDDARKKRAVQPIPRPQDRYACSDKRLGHAFHAQQHIAATTLEGERFTGEIAWVSRFEIGVRIKGDREVVVFRHALDLLEEVGKHEKK